MQAVPDIILQNPILVVSLVMDIGLGANIIRNLLHPYIGNFDIALILQDLDPKAKGSGKVNEPKAWMMFARREFNAQKEAFRVGKGNDAYTYKVDPSKVAFLQRHHRVYYYERGHAYPMSYAYGMNVVKTTSKGMDLFVAQKLWQQAVAATQKLSFTLPILMLLVTLAAGAGVGFMAFYFIHPGFEPIGTGQAIQNATHTTVTFGG